MVNLGKVVRTECPDPLRTRGTVPDGLIRLSASVYGLREVVLRPNDSIPLCQHVVLDEPKAALSALL